MCACVCECVCVCALRVSAGPWPLGLPPPPGTSPAVRMGGPSRLCTDGPLPLSFPGPGSLVLLGEPGLHNRCAGSGWWEGCRAPPWPRRGGPQLLPRGGVSVGRGEEGGQRGRGLGTGESRKEEQLLTCLSAQLFVSGSQRETEAAGGGKSHTAGPAVLLPRPQVLTPEQNHQREIGRGSPSLSLLRKASLGPIGSSLCANTCDAVRARGSVHADTAPWWAVPLLRVSTGANAQVFLGLCLPCPLCEP